MTELELDERTELDDMMLELERTRLDEELDIRLEERLDLEELTTELATELWLDGVTEAR